MELLCIQSQEHPELPLAELTAVIECENINTQINSITEGLVILKNISQKNIKSYYEILTKRLGYTHEIHEFITKTNIKNLKENISKINWSEYINETFAVRVKRIRSDIDTVGTERELGTLILDNCENIKVNLTKPKTLIRVVAHKNDLYIGIERIKIIKNILKKANLIKDHFFILDL